MSAFVGDPALRRLARLKLRGFARRNLRRLATPSGAVFALLGIALVLVWLAGLGMAVMLGAQRAIAESDALPLARVAVFGLFVLSISGNVSHRGLYLPAQEIERLFSAPVARADVIRYRLHVVLAQSSIGGVIVAAIAATRMPHPLSATVGAALVVATVAVGGQGLALCLGGLERRLSLGALRVGARVLTAALVAAAIGLFLLLDELPGDLRSTLSSLPTDPRVVALTRPVEPWARLVTAETPAALLGWGGLCLALLLVLFEAVARVPFDFRELSLANAQDVAARMRRIRRGGVASAQRIRGGDALRRVPWVLGRATLGAIVWRKLAGILRRARATLLFSSFMLAVLVVSAVAIADADDPGSKVSGTAMIAVLGTFYLASGLRFDFREDVERMDVLKAWPLSSRALFVATLLPETALIVGLLTAGLGVHAAVVGAPVDLVGAVALTVPLFVWIWLALDNAFFLIWPVRVVPGQDGALQNMGRASVFMVLRIMVLMVLLGVAVALAALARLLAFEFVDATPEAALWTALAAGWAVLVLGCGAVALFGAGAVRRFDPSRLE